LRIWVPEELSYGMTETVGYRKAAKLLEDLCPLSLILDTCVRKKMFFF